MRKLVVVGGKGVGKGGKVGKEKGIFASTALPDHSLSEVSPFFSLRIVLSLSHHFPSFFHLLCPFCFPLLGKWVFNAEWGMEILLELRSVPRRGTKD